MVTYLLRYPIESFAVIITIFPLVSMIYRKAYKQKVLRYFFWYLVAKLVIDLMMLVIASKSQNNLFLYNIWVLVGMLLLSAMMYNIANSEPYKKAIEVGAISFVALLAMDWIEVGWGQTLKLAPTSQCLLMVLWLGIYFVHLAKSKESVDLMRNLVFWICSALMIYFSCCAFLTPIYNHYDQVGAGQDFYILNILPYLFEISYLSVIGFGILVSE